LPNIEVSWYLSGCPTSAISTFLVGYKRIIILFFLNELIKIFELSLSQREEIFGIISRKNKMMILE
jgi:hypothetical protein